jgi:hypothetical protein
MTEDSNSNCVCPANSQDNGSKCVSCTSSQWYDSSSHKCVPKPSCTNQQTYNPATNMCDNKCSDPMQYWSWQSGSNTNGRCCKIGWSCQQTKCCPNGQVEISGNCCPAGSTWNGWQCISPSNVKRRRSVPQLPMDPKSVAMREALNLDIKLCPQGLSACPIPGQFSGQYECIDASTDITSCGGCASIGKGVDCMSEGVRFAGCNRGLCEVYSCLKGWKQVNGTSCEQL